MEATSLSIFSLISIIVLVIVYFFLITEKVDKAIVAVLGAALLVDLQVFRTASHTSQEQAFEFISRNLDVLGFVIGMMVLVGIVRESGFFEAIAIKLVKIVKGDPTKLLIVMSYLTLVMTALLSNIPTVLILTPILIILIKELKLPYFPYFFAMIVMANIGGAMTPISDPTTYYQAKTVGLGFLEVITNSGIIVIVLSVISVLYSIIVFRSDLKKVVVNPASVAEFNPASAIRDRKILAWGLPLLASSIVLMVLKDFIHQKTGITLDNATITLGASFIAIFIFHKHPKEIFQRLIDWEIIFFFMGLFIVVGSLEFTGVISKLGGFLVTITHGDINSLLLLVTMGSSIISTFIDNVPYNITMVSAIQAMAASGIVVYPLWWALNLGTSIGGAGSPIAAACNVIALGRAEQDNLHFKFVKFLATAFPLVIINGLVTYAILWLRYLN